MQTDIYYFDPTPQLTIEKQFGRGLTYVVTSHRKLTTDQLFALFNDGFMTFGQEMRVVGYDVVEITLPCTVVERHTYRVVGPHPTKTFVAKRYVYECRVTCDSSG